jgi:RNA-directed DNA polymerase
MHWSWNHSKWYLGASPSKRSVAKLKESVREQLRPSNKEPWPEVCSQLNTLLRGWAGYFSYGYRTGAYRAVERYVYDRVRGFLGKRQKVLSRGTRAFPWDMVFGELGIIELRRPLYASQS